MPLTVPNVAFAGKADTHKLGRYPTLKLKEAREKFRQFDPEKP